MELTADQAELFPSIERRARRPSAFRQMLEATEQHGPLLPRAMVPLVLDVSRQRLHTLIREGRIATIMVNGTEFIPAVALDLFLADERKIGRPVSELTLGESLRRHVFKK